MTAEPRDTGAPAGDPLHWAYGPILFFVVMGLQLVLGVLLVVAAMLGWIGDPSAEGTLAQLLTPGSVGLQVAITSSMLIGVSLLAPRALGVRPGRWLGLRRPPAAVFALTLAGTAAMGVVVDQLLFGFKQLAPGAFDSAMLEAFAAVFVRASLPAFAGLTALVALGPGLGEELFFRGILQRSLNTRFGAATAVALSATAFGAMHLDLVQGSGAALIGLYIGAIAWRTGSVWPGVAAHVLNNVISSLTARLGSGEPQATWDEGHPWWLVTISAAAVLGSLVGIWRVTGRGAQSS